MAYLGTVASRFAPLSPNSRNAGKNACSGASTRGIWRSPAVSHGWNPTPLLHGTASARLVSNGLICVNGAPAHTQSGLLDQSGHAAPLFLVALATTAGFVAALAFQSSFAFDAVVRVLGGH